MFIDAYLGLCTAVGAGTATEFVGSSYARQPIAFSEPVDGVCFNTTPFGFGQLRVPGWAGRALYDASAGGNLLLVLPHPTPLSNWRPLWDGGDSGTLRLTFAAMQGFHRGGAFTGQLATGSVVGLCSDVYDVVTSSDLGQSLGNPKPLINTGLLSTGVALSIARGTLTALSMVPVGAE